MNNLQTDKRNYKSHKPFHSSDLCVKCCISFILRISTIYFLSRAKFYVVYSLLGENTMHITTSVSIIITSVSFLSVAITTYKNNFLFYSIL